MTTLATADKHRQRASLIRATAVWIGLAAAPAFAAMAWITTADMSTMYLLMSVFQLPAWLKLASGRSDRPTHPKPRN